MSTSFRLEHDFPDIPVERFEKHLNHPELIGMLGAMPAFRSRELHEKKDLPGGAINWRFKVVAGGQLPADQARLLQPLDRRIERPVSDGADVTGQGGQPVAQLMMQRLVHGPYHVMRYRRLMVRTMHQF